MWLLSNHQLWPLLLINSGRKALPSHRFVSLEVYISLQHLSHAGGVALSLDNSSSLFRPAGTLTHYCLRPVYFENCRCESSTLRDIDGVMLRNPRRIQATGYACDRLRACSDCEVEACNHCMVLLQRRRTYDAFTYCHLPSSIGVDNIFRPLDSWYRLLQTYRGSFLSVEGRKGSTVVFVSAS